MLEVNAINLHYGAAQALRGITMKAEPGKVTCVLGRNGVGKTSLLDALMGQHPVSSGTIVWEGNDITALKPADRARRGIAYVPQGREIFPLLTVEENLETGFAPLKRDQRSIPDDVFSLFPVLNSMLRRRGGDLSGGQQQQLAIGRALVMRPRLLLLDEPTEGIQPSIIKDIGRAISYLRNLGQIAIILVEQYLDFAQELGDQFLVMDRGAVIYAIEPRRSRRGGAQARDGDLSLVGGGRDGAVAAKRRGDLRRQPRGRQRRASPSSTSAGKTRRAHVHEAGSLRVRCPGAPAEELEAVIINTAGGIAGGDRFALDIAAGQGTRLVVTTAAAEKVYRTLGPDSVIDVKLDVAAGATLAWLPQETILFDRARLSRAASRSIVAPDAQLFLAEAIVFGRSGMGEAVEQGALIDRWRVRRGGKLDLCGTRAARRRDCAAAGRASCCQRRHRDRNGADRARATTRSQAVRALQDRSPARSARRPGTASRPCACALPTALRYATTSSML